MATEIQDILTPEFTKLLLESMADGVFTLDPKGIITSWNPSMELITGYTAAEALGKNCTLLSFNRCFGRRCPSGLMECGIFKRGAVDGKECLLRHKDGHDAPVLKSARLLKDENGNVKGVVETVTDITELKKTRQEMEEANRKLGEIHRLDNIIGKSHSIRQVFSAVKAAAASDAAILIQGESGTGKELVAGAIHYNSARAERPLVTVNCSALSESLLESELFGHVKGAFTGAVRDRTGRFEEAHGGTVFLDEIGEINPYIQVKLLRVLQEKEIERVGESASRKIDIRIIAATNKDLYSLVREGKFREDLYYRLKVFPISVPPLRDRKEDLPLLTNHFIRIQNEKTGKRIEAAARDAMRVMMDYHWPGNVRELENAVEHAFVLCNESEFDVFDLPVEIREVDFRAHGTPETPPVTRRARKKIDKESLVELLVECDWNKAEAARRLGVSRTAVWKYMKKWKIPLQKPIG
ncbi:MAG: PAS domain S-box protein [Desulfobacterales bacterium]|nr:PAS domain S-box protein [Desulfobacterales bacterium]